MKFHRKWLVVSLTGVVAASALAQETANSPGGRVAEVTWTKDGTYEWARPAHVRYVLVRACGGGGGGGGGYSLAPRPTARDGTAVGGGGGAGAPVSTTLLGPLSAASYTVVIGRGGAGGSSKIAAKSTSADLSGNKGAAGMPTSFTGPDISFETPGAVGGNVGGSQTRMSAEGTMYEFFVTRAGSSGGSYAGGGTAQSGARGLLGLGGAGNTDGFSGGGGGGSLGAGGAGGSADNGGADGGTCAGGGGAGFLESKDAKSSGGQGGAGSVTLLSIASSQDKR
jgi:hypothetical protein